MGRIKLLLGPVLFLLIYILGGGEDFYSSIALASWMVYWWITESTPLYVTALLPIIFGPALKLIDTNDLSMSYGNTMVFLFLGGFIIALAIEKWDVHRKIAALIVRRTGSSPAGVLLGFILSTAFLSMWLSNTGTAIMMIPMAMTVLAVVPQGEFNKRFSTALLLSIAFAANIGGTATLIGSPPNVQMSGILADKYNVQVDFLDWMKIGLPFSIALLAVLYIYLKLVFLKSKEQIEIVFKEETKWSVNQRKVLAVFLTTVTLWIVKQYINEFFQWSITDTQIAIFGGIALFLVPSSNKEELNTKLLSWTDTKELPWGILILFGGGLALARSLANGGVLTKFATWIADNGGDSYFWLLLILILAGVFLTELMSNLALVTILIPIIAELALEMDYPILALCIPVTLSASCAFMLPMATPPNAIVFASGKLKVQTMARVGFVMNVVAILAVSVVAYLLTIIMM